LSAASVEIDNYNTSLREFNQLEILKNSVLDGNAHLFDLRALNSEIGAMKTMKGYLDSLASLNIVSSITGGISRALNTMTMSWLDAYRLVSGVVYAFGSLFATFRFMIPDIRGPVQTFTSVIENAFIRLGTVVDAAAASVIRPMQRMVDAVSETLGMFLFFDTRVQRAWINLAKSRGLQELIGSVYELGDALQTRNLSNFWLILYDKVKFS
jgi:hypothetical protein